MSHKNDDKSNRLYTVLETVEALWQERKDIDESKKIALADAIRKFDKVAADKIMKEGFPKWAICGSKIYPIMYELLGRDLKVKESSIMEDYQLVFSWIDPNNMSVGSLNGF